MAKRKAKLSKIEKAEQPILAPLGGGSATAVEDPPEEQSGPTVFQRKLQHEVHSEDETKDQFDDIVMPEIDEAFQHHRDAISPNIEKLQKEYNDALQFNMEPIAIRIEPSNEENPPMFIDCWVNGKGCEIWDKATRGWLSVGAFPVGVIVVTRRKYVEVLARAKKINVKTIIVDPNAEKPQNKVRRVMTQMAVFSVIEDRNPKGRAWIRALTSSK